jgi:protein-disulfide isomerase
MLFRTLIESVLRARFLGGPCHRRLRAGRQLILLALPAVLGLASAPVAASEFTPAQRAEIVEILRDALRQDPSILRDALGSMEAQEGERQKAASRAAIAAAGSSLVGPSDPVAGNPHGDVTIVEFFDTRCPYCRKLEPEMSRLLAADHGVRLVYKDLPILGPASLFGSRALLAAEKQGGYEKLRTAIMKAPPDLNQATMEAAAKDVGLDLPRLRHDMQDPTISERIDANLKLARALGVEGTPAIVVGGELIDGAVDLDELRKAVATARSK